MPWCEKWPSWALNTSCHFLLSWCGLSCSCLVYMIIDQLITSFYQVIFPKCFLMLCMCNLLSVFPGRLCDGPSSPCRPQATSCWVPPATLSSCWRKRSGQRRAWHCHRKAESGSCRACCWEKSPTDGLELMSSLRFRTQCRCHFYKQVVFTWSCQFPVRFWNMLDIATVFSQSLCLLHCFCVMYVEANTTNYSSESTFTHNCNFFLWR